MDDEPSFPRPSGELETERATWDSLVDSNSEWVWAAVGRNRDLFLLVWLRLADRWPGNGPESGEMLLRHVLAGLKRGSMPAAALASEPLRASGS